MAVSPLVRPLGIAATILASIQGLAWSVLALLGILIYAEAWTLDPEDDVSIRNALYTLFLRSNDASSLIMRADNMIIFTSLYLAFSLLWMIVSLCHLWIAIREKWEFAKYTLVSWATCTGIISILDIVTMVLFAVDYNEMKYELEQEEDNVTFHDVSATAIMMVVAARGFALLIANIVFTVLFAYWGVTFDEQNNRQQPKREFINGYDQNRPPTWLANGNTGGLGRPYSNPGYEPEVPERPISYERNRYNRSPPSDNFARIGRNNLRPSTNTQPSYQPPPRERGPYIPEPDYSPTSLRKHPKSVLKSRNHY